MNVVIADVLRSFAADRGDDWQDFVPLAEFAINDSASALGSATLSSMPTAVSILGALSTPRPPLFGDASWFRRVSHASDEPGDGRSTRVAESASGPAQSSSGRSSAGRPVRHGRRGAARYRTYAAPLTVAPFPALDGPLQGTCTSGAQHVPPRATWYACDEFNVERLRPYCRRTEGLCCAPGPPPPVPGADGGPEYEVQELLKSKMRWGRPYVKATSWCAGRAAMRCATPGSRWTTSG